MTILTRSSGPEVRATSMRTKRIAEPRRADASEIIRLATGEQGKSWSDATIVSPYIRWSVLYVTSAHDLCRGGRVDRYHTSLVIHPEAAARLAGISEIRAWMAEHPLTPTIVVPGDGPARRIPLTIAAFPILLDECMIDGTVDDVADTCLVVRRMSKRDEPQVMLKLIRIFG